jgi:hypothetical protein
LHYGKAVESLLLLGKVNLQRSDLVSLEGTNQRADLTIGCLIFRPNGGRSYTNAACSRAGSKWRAFRNLTRSKNPAYPDINYVGKVYEWIGMWYKRAEYSLERFILVGPRPMPEEEWTKLCERYGVYQNRVPPGDALLIDLRSDEPRLVSVSVDHKPQEVPI